MAIESTDFQVTSEKEDIEMLEALEDSELLEASRQFEQKQEVQAIVVSLISDILNQVKTQDEIIRSQNQELNANKQTIKKLIEKLAKAVGEKNCERNKRKRAEKLLTVNMRTISFLRRKNNRKNEQVDTISMEDINDMKDSMFMEDMEDSMFMEGIKQDGTERGAGRLHG